MPLVSYDCEGMKIEDVKKKIKDIGKPVLLKFSMERCPPCESLKRDLAGYKTDIEINILEFHRSKTSNLDGDLLEKYDITGFPTVILVNEDADQVDEMRGFSHISKFNELIEKHRKLLEANGKK